MAEKTIAVTVSKVTRVSFRKPSHEYPWLCGLFGHRKQARYIRASFRGPVLQDDLFYYQDCLRRQCLWSSME